MNHPAHLSLADHLVRLVYRIGFAVARLWWWLRRPRHRGALVAIWVDQHILLLRNAYRAAMNFPGGGINAGETPLQAACRECIEEISLPVDPSFLSLALEHVFFWEYRHDHVWIFECHLPARPTLRLDNREIIAAQWMTRAQALAVRLPPHIRSYLENN